MMILTGLTACNQDFNDDIASPLTSDAETAQTVAFGNGAVKSVGTINLNETKADSVQVCEITEPTVTDQDAYLLSYVIVLGGEEYPITSNGVMSAKEISDYVTSIYGKRPETRTVTAVVKAYYNSNGQTIVTKSDEFNINLIPNVPTLYSTYYITGSINGWDNTNTDYAVVNSGADPYEDPVYTITLSADVVGSGFEFKLTPDQGLGGDWSTCVSAAASGEEGRVSTANEGGNLKVEAVEGATSYVLTFNLLDETWSVKALMFEDAYYITGGINGWDNSNTDYKLTNIGSDDDPCFTITLSADVVGEGFEFKLTPESGLGGDWSKCISATASGEQGKLSLSNEGGNLKVEAVEGAKFYRLKFYLAQGTWTCETLAFGEYFYEIGNESGWSTSHPLYGGDGDGKYRGFYYLNGEFKFKPNADNWDNDLEYVSDGVLTESGGPNVPDPGAGFYMIDLDAAAYTYALTKVESIGIIGGFNSWGGDEEMTYNVEGGYWEATVTFDSDTEYKFRMNHDWSVNWGGTLDNLTHNGDNLKATAGTHTIKLYLGCVGTFKATVE